MLPNQQMRFPTSTLGTRSVCSSHCLERPAEVAAGPNRPAASSSPPMVGDPSGDFSTNLVLHGVPIRATRFEISNELISVGLPRLAQGNIIRHGADLHVCIKLTRSLPTSGGANGSRLTGAKAILRKNLNWRVTVKQVKRRANDVGPPLPLPETPKWVEPHHWALPSRGHEIRVASFNACGLSAMKQKEIEDALMGMGIGICAVQESHEKANMALHFTHYQWVGRPRKGLLKSGGGGVGFLLHNSLVSDVSVADTRGAQEAMWLIVDGSCREAAPLILASVYLPCNPNTRADKEICARAFELLEADVVRFQQQGRVVLLGDFNARVGQALEAGAHIGMYGEARSNWNGAQFTAMLERTKMYAVNGRIREYLGYPQYTRSAWNGEVHSSSSIDYIAVDADTLEGMANGRIHMVDIHRSDHRLLAVPLPYMTRPHRRPHAPRRSVWRLNRLRSDVNVQEAYSGAIKGGLLQFLSNLDTVRTDATLTVRDKLESGHNYLASLVVPAAELTIGRTYVGEDRVARWWDLKLQHATRARRACVAQFRSLGTAEARQRLRVASQSLSNLKKAKLQAVKKTEMRRVNTLARDPTQSKALWQALDWRRTHMVKGARNPTPVVRMPGGGLVCDEPRVCEAFKQKFEAVGKVQNNAEYHYDEAHRQTVERAVAEYTCLAQSDPDADGLGKSITEAEVEAALQATKTYRASTQGDLLVNELLRFGGSPLAKALVPLFNMAFCNAAVPASWRAGEIICLHKKGDKSDVSNYRGITLMCALGKLYARVLNTRLMEHLDPLLHEAQCGFRPGRSCVDHIYSASQFIQGRIKEGKTTFGFYLDGERAFDTVWRDGLFYKLWAKGVRGHMWLAIRGLMTQTSCRVRIGGSMSEAFTREQGIDQGCLLSTSLYSVFIDDLASDVSLALQAHTPEAPVFQQGKYADDYNNCTANAEECQTAVNACYAHTQKWRWQANLGKNKTAVVIFGTPSALSRADPPIMWGDKPVLQQESYRLLGVLLSASGTWDEHLADLLQKVKSRVHQLRKFLSSPDLAVPVKRMLVKTCLLPALEYGSAVWHATRRQSDLLRTQYLKALKMMLQCPVSTPTEAVMGDLGMPSLQHRWDLNKMRFEFKLQHMPVTRDPQAVFMTDWSAGRGKRHMLHNKLISIWKQLFPAATVRSTKQAALQALAPKQFDTAVRQLIAVRDSKTLLRDMRSKVKLGLYSKVCGLESQHLPERRHSFLELSPYLSAVLSPAKRLKFLFRAGVAELGPELALRSRGSQNSSVTRLNEGCCPFCPGVQETQEHFLVSCPQYDDLRAEFWGKLHGVIPITAAFLQGLTARELTAHILADTLGAGEVVSQARTRAPPVAQLVEEHLQNLWNLRKSQTPGSA